MSLDQLLAEAMRLPANEKALLAGSLWETLGDPFRSGEGEQEAVTLALERDREMESGQATAISHEELMRRLRQ
jgi:hypothetical protein